MQDTITTLTPKNNSFIYNELNEKCKEVALIIELEFIGLNYDEIEQICTAVLNEAKRKCSFMYTSYENFNFDTESSFTTSNKEI